MSSSLGPASRAAALQAMQSEVLDLLVVGAGATGTGTALDAASRGLSRRPHRQGRHRQRHVEPVQPARARRPALPAAGQRRPRPGVPARARAAAHHPGTASGAARCRSCCRCTHRVWERLYIGAGLLAYDVIGGAGAVPRHRHLSKRGALARFPDLRPDALIGALQYYDAQMDDARLAVAIARTAAREGAHVAPHTSLVGRLADERGRRPPRGGARRADRRRVRRVGAVRRPVRGSVGAGGLRRCSPSPTTPSASSGPRACTCGCPARPSTARRR